MDTLDLRAPASAAGVLQECHRRGIRLRAALDTGEIDYDGPDGSMTAELLDQLRASKSDILALIREAQAARPAGAQCWADPRPDMATDSATWETVLALAYHLAARDPWGVFGLLRGLRCEGARLVRIDDALHLVPPECVTEAELWAEWVGDHAGLVRYLLSMIKE